MLSNRDASEVARLRSATIAAAAIDTDLICKSTRRHPRLINVTTPHSILNCSPDCDILGGSHSVNSPVPTIATSSPAWWGRDQPLDIASS